MTPQVDLWTRAELALTLLAVDPVGLGGMWLRSSAGPVRDRLVSGFDVLPIPLRRVQAEIGDGALMGGIDLATSLGAGRILFGRAGLGEPSALLLRLAEHCPTGLAAWLGRALDDRQHCLLALDEVSEPGTALPPAISERLGLCVALDGLAEAECPPLELNHGLIGRSRDRLPFVFLPPDAPGDLAILAARLGVDSLRAPILALNAAKASAALFGRGTVVEDDLILAAELVLSHRMPSPDAEVARDATLERLSPSVQKFLSAQRPETSRRGGAVGARAHRRARPEPRWTETPDKGARVDLVASLRAAAPIQKAAMTQSAEGPAIHLDPPGNPAEAPASEGERLLIFVVDASGPFAMARMTEAKAAVAMIPDAEALVRDNVTLLACGAEGPTLELLPAPLLGSASATRAGESLGSPLTGGLRLAAVIAGEALAKGMEPILAVLCDGHSAPDDGAVQAMRDLRALDLLGVVIDSSPKPEPLLETLAREMAAPYLSLPQAAATGISAVLGAALTD
ncbi:MAG: hypothetical protein HUJ27_15740 [Rhodobacteraceae bacterium]|nr:hypothetical protein [Paracoccaceae bacterium]